MTFLFSSNKKSYSNYKKISDSRSCITCLSENNFISILHNYLGNNNKGEENTKIYKTNLGG